MKNYILTLSLAAMFIAFAPVLTIARPMIEIVDMMDIDTQGITISVNQNTQRLKQHFTTPAHLVLALAC